MLSLYSLTRGGSISDIRTYALGYPVWMYSFKKEFEMSDAVVAVSEALMKGLFFDIGNRNQGKMLYIHNGVDIEVLEKEYSNVCFEREKDDPIIFSAGRLYWRKGVLNLVRLAYFLEKKHHLNLKIVIHGSGPLRGKIEKMTREYGLTNIVLKGFTTRAEFLKDMKRAVCVVIPSIFEACPMLLLESMCLGKIPVMFDLPYSAELTKNGEYGILARNVEDMAMRIKLLSTQFDVGHLENKIKDFAKREYDVAKTASEYHHLYQSVVNEK
jgi:glycosyltransferase involved in cell wall biosynthesis